MAAGTLCSAPLFLPPLSHRTPQPIHSLCFNPPSISLSRSKFSGAAVVAPRLARQVFRVHGLVGDDSVTAPEPESPNSEAGASIDLNLPRRRLLVQFSCDLCGERTKRLVNRLAYERGAVFVQEVTGLYCCVSACSGSPITNGMANVLDHVSKLGDGAGVVSDSAAVSSGGVGTSTTGAGACVGGEGTGDGVGAGFVGVGAGFAFACAGAGGVFAGVGAIFDSGNGLCKLKQTHARSTRIVSLRMIWKILENKANIGC
ncbi:mitochondrial protein import protein ZIM17 [Spatholobus suberectus]|nr:mitochondrial protein import protein ZIM17 [Spatholobus suberectus]